MERKNGNEYDDIFRQKLSKIVPEYHPGSWDSLANRLDEAEQTDAFDNDVADQLDQIHVPYNTSSWSLLAARLELEQKRLQTVLHFKTMELSLLFLLFLTAWQHLPAWLPPQPIHPVYQGPVAESAAEPAKAEETFALSADQTPSSADELSHEEESLAATTTGAAALEPGTDSWSTALLDDLISSVEPYPQERPQMAPLPTTDLTEVNSEMAARQQLRELHAERTAPVTSPSDEFVHTGPMAGLAGNSFSLLNYGEAEELLDHIRPVERKTFLRIGFVGSPDYNRVITPPTVVGSDSVVTLDRYSLGYSGGITLGIERGKWEIETGAIYAARRYQSIPTVYVSGSIKEGGFYGVSLSDFELNTVNIPLNFRYNAFVQDKWRLYAIAGASLNVVTQANYYTVNLESYESLQGGLQQNDRTPSAETLPPIKSKALTKGWLDGGPFWNNATLFGNAGVGVERYMSSHWSIFAQPTYQHSFPLFNSGLGPYNDQLHSVSIFMGLKVRL